ncbi:MAG: hypothetical protein U0Z26_18335 [Anaerolineales bacterium]
MDKRLQITWRSIGEFVGAVAIITLIVALLQLRQSKEASNSQDSAQATQLALLQAQLDVQRRVATLQASGLESGPDSTLVANQISELQSTAIALATQEARFNQQGDLVVDENFEDGIANGFTTGGDGNDWSWEVVDDGTGNMVFEVNNPAAVWSHSVFGPREFSDGIIQFRVRLLDYDLSSDTGSGIALLSFREISRVGGYVLALHAFQRQVSLYYFGPDQHWIPLNYGGTTYEFNKNIWYEVELKAKGGNIQSYLNTVSVGTSNDSRFVKGEVHISAGPSTIAQFDDVKVWVSK